MTQEDIDYLAKYSAAAMNNKWYVNENDLVGGWAIGLLDKPVSEYNYSANKDAEPPHLLVCDFLCLEVAKYLVALANADRNLE